MKGKTALPLRMMLVLIPFLCLSCIAPAFALTDQQAKVPGYTGFEKYPEKFDFDGMPRSIPTGEIERITNRKIKVGMVVTKKNVEGIKKELIALTSPGIYNMVKKGMELVIADYKPWPVPKVYGAVTKANRGKAVIAFDGNLKTTTGAWWPGGEPFPDLMEQDPDAGLKAWYNQVHVYDGDDFTHDWVNMLFIGSKGKQERVVEMSWDRIFLTSREILAPKPTYDSRMNDIFFKELVYVQTPADLQGYGNLTYRYNDQNRLDDSFTYIPMMRRIRRVTSGQRFDSFVGSDSSIGDFRTLDVPVARWHWKLINVQPKLTTLFSTDFITENRAAQRRHPTTVGEKFPRMYWRLWPQVYVIEATPKTPSDCGLYSKKILWVLGGCWKSGLADAYDLRGRLWKTTQNYFYGYGDGQMLDLLSHYETDFYTYDHQRDHASPWLIDLPYRKFNVGFPAERFSTKYLQRYGH
ncbi:MAG TPA: DUF1329 domain-containing protein [Syntrophales bacterium]|nr:DUF1329 domain-containing protein [Syntrophales bacterium]HPX55840.1 DUF1329 domain-containing protein [Syntrophales bacterium]HQA82584.1 DUF1329 domain-containing protein [Syntrophales bacterium]